ncbi:MAG: hypothetical protein CL878_04000 [Dehalococcoidia bacterium]|nr:hypothetical protein [Dehalococcoidia bacterium]
MGGPQDRGGPVQFRHQVIDADPPGSHHDITLLADLTGNGLNDIIIGGKQGEVTLFWYENPTWQRHAIASTPHLEAGGVLLDLTGNGRLDIVAGTEHGNRELYWYENPPDPRQRWPHYIIEDRFLKYHDQVVGDVDGDGQPELLITSQQSGILAYYDLPADPRVSPWPKECFHLVAEGIPDVEGLAIVDLDGDGRTEIIAGPHLFRPGDDPRDPWRRQTFAPEFVKTRVAVADLDGDGELELVLSEGESHPARLAWCKAPTWEPRVLRDDLFHPHSLEVADFTGDGRPDIFVAEMGLGRNADPRIMILVNQGRGEFETVIIERGIPTHEAKLADMTGDGRLDIVGKPFDPERHIDIWFNET